jgi:anti-sigma B factor antagonist
MGLSVERDGARALVRLDGPLDYPATEELEARLAGLLDVGIRHVAVDLTAVTAVDDAAVGVLYDALRRARAGRGAITLALTDDRLARVLQVMGLDRAFPLASSGEEALRLLPQSAGGGEGSVSGSLVDWPAEGR